MKLWTVLKVTSVFLILSILIHFSRCMSIKPSASFPSTLLSTHASTSTSTEKKETEDNTSAQSYLSSKSKEIVPAQIVLPLASPLAIPKVSTDGTDVFTRVKRKGARGGGFGGGSKGGPRDRLDYRKNQASASLHFSFTLLIVSSLMITANYNR